MSGTPRDYSLSKEEWLAMRDVAEDRNNSIKPADKGSCVVLWDREDYLAEDTDFKESSLVKLVEKSNTMFQSLGKKNLITEKELKYFIINIKSHKILVKCISFRKFIRY